MGYITETSQNPDNIAADRTSFHTGTDFTAYLEMGAHICEEDGISGTRFRVWAPNAVNACVITRAASRDEKGGVMTKNADGVFECFVPGAEKGDGYRYVITGADGSKRWKADPYAFFSEKRPDNASVIWPADTYEWKDSEYLENIPSDCTASLRKPLSIYEVHPGSWKKNYDKGPDGFLNYRELGRQLSEYCEFMGYTHVELMGICEHPFDNSWGYQVTGYFAPTSRYGTPDDFKFLVDCLHNKGIGVILDWVPAHFPKDDYSLKEFDGTKLYEPEDPLRAEYPEWGTLAFDHAKPEVRSFLISSAYYWIKEFHVDALRVDAVASMLFLDFGRSRYALNKDGGRDNYESTAFLKQLNETIRRNTKGYLIAEDSSIKRGITAPVEKEGFGFLYKWNMGWMNDTLRYINRDPVYRRYHHDEITRTVDYAFYENFILVLSHDEVVHLKKSMYGKMFGTEDDKLEALKAFYTFQYVHPGKKLLFMGQEFGDPSEWDENRCLPWELSHDKKHRELMLCVKQLNEIYKSFPALYTDTGDPHTFEWISKNDRDRNIISFIRRNPWNFDGAVIAVINFSPVSYNDFSCGTPVEGAYRCLFRTYHSAEKADIISERGECDSHPFKLSFSLRPYEAVLLLFPDSAGTE